MNGTLVITIVAIIGILTAAIIFFMLGYRRGVEHGTTAMADMYEKYISKFFKDEEKTDN